MGFFLQAQQHFVERCALVLQRAPNITQKEKKKKNEHKFMNRSPIAWICDSEIHSSYHTSYTRKLRNSDSNWCPVSRFAIHRASPWRLKPNLILYGAEQALKILKYSEILRGSWKYIQRENDLMKGQCLPNSITINKWHLRWNIFSVSQLKARGCHSPYLLSADACFQQDMGQNPN